MTKPSFLLAGIFLTALVGGAPQTDRPDSVIPAVDDAPTKAGSYNWMDRHNSVLARLKQGHVDLILVGDSITHGWGGSPDPTRNDAIGELWTKYFGSRNAVNEGFGWDRTQHVLWRFDHGELDGISPKVAIVLIGTNNIGVNKPMDVVRGIGAVVQELQQKLPTTKVLLLGIFPRDEKPDTFNRKQVAEVNGIVANTVGKRKGVTYLDLGSAFVQSDGTISSDVMHDFLHPTAKGYALWVQAMEPTLANLMGDTPRQYEVKTGD
ncbi:MAG: platelet-activating factor acetylhydrolase IB subunit [Fimbriimonadaceae bacterium]